MRIPNTLMRLLRDQHGATMVEYGLILGLVSMAAVGYMTSIGDNIETKILDISSAAISGEAPEE